LYVESDPTQLERILRNLVENAIKHMGKHTGRCGRILLGTRRKGQTLRIEVWDNGIGIAKSEQQAIFREFYQLHNPERKRERGIGLGLAIIKRTAIALGHRLELRSQPNQGSMFAITVPRATPLCPTYSPLHSTESQPQPTLQGKILIIEDDTAVAESLSTLLTLWGYHTITSSLPNPEQLITQHPDIRFIISDYQLAAGVDGISVIQHLRQVARNDIPALLITGNTSPALAQQLQQLNIPVSYKPINPLNLKLLIN
jgi:CheY-like chemotaxis protein/anti-sigma regulatory factor (Ser/Thr protein kinase)